MYPTLGKLSGVAIGLLAIALGLAAPAVFSPALSWRPPTLEHRSPVAVPVVYKTAMLVQQVKRKVYPYSIVPGGAENLHEAKWAMADPAVKAHYAGVDVAGLKQVKLASNLTGYVSYRWGDKVYWTAKKVTIRAGESVFTDGAHVVRGRCLNCYSALPMQPIRPHEPTEAILDAPVEMPVTVYSFPKLPLLATALPVLPPPGELTPTIPVIPSSVTPPPGRPPGGIWFPLIPIIPPIHHRQGTPTGPTSPGTPLVPPPVAIVPEPGYIWLLVVGFLAMLLALRFSPERRRR